MPNFYIIGLIARKIFFPNFKGERGTPMGLLEPVGNLEADERHDDDNADDNCNENSDLRAVEHDRTVIQHYLPGHVGTCPSQRDYTAAFDDYNIINTPTKHHYYCCYCWYYTVSRKTVQQNHFVRTL